VILEKNEANSWFTSHVVLPHYRLFASYFYLQEASDLPMRGRAHDMLGL
jgi:hypothetical protein